MPETPVQVPVQRQVLVRVSEPEVSPQPKPEVCQELPVLREVSAPMEVWSPEPSRPVSARS